MRTALCRRELLRGREELFELLRTANTYRGRDLGRWDDSRSRWKDPLGTSSGVPSARMEVRIRAASAVGATCRSRAPLVLHDGSVERTPCQLPPHRREGATPMFPAYRRRDGTLGRASPESRSARATASESHGFAACALRTGHRRAGRGHRRGQSPRDRGFLAGTRPGAPVRASASGPTMPPLRR